ncbi:NAD(P)-dependent oxidoreductase [Mesobaculum littorinae]|uniref:NAD(P)-dependent oxidoreductase n=1 Tax=Mesobaculum littorinae TaxID=2486419 RepID=A0A438AL04_9RHOB|nr:NAD(P)-dependent oxidoreductase [Mesobaculum littorinae]RVV99295.1 NAD(P)-dependent oxidoreductase [Mesobaculum littorinae]
METGRTTPGVVAGRLPPDAYETNFADLHPRYDPHEAHVAADRCYFCYDAPCITACPTAIDIPLFIRQIATGLPEAAARTIFDSNILGGMCARVCPTETLCEEACVREAAEGKPVEIGRLQRYATDTLIGAGVHPYTRAAPTGRRIAVIGAGPGGLSCAHGLARRGHDVTVFEARPRPGGLNEYGIASYKTPDGFAQKEVAWLMQIGGITIEYGAEIGRDRSFDDIRAAHDAVFIGNGLRGVNALGLDGEDMAGVEDAVDFIARLRQAGDRAALPVGRDVVVIGGGMTAVDAAIQARLLGAQNVTMVYRRGAERLNASVYEQNLAQINGVRLITGAVPVRLHGDRAVERVEFAYTSDEGGRLVTMNDGFWLPADQVLKAIGQVMQPLTADPEAALDLDGTKLRTAGTGAVPSHPGVFAGGDCTASGEALTVTAVAQGRDAAAAIHDYLTDAQPAQKEPA